MKTTAALVALFFSVHWAFVAIMHAKSLGKRITLYWRLVLVPLAIIGVVADVAFNMIFGTVVYLELPREWLFTARCRRHFRGKRGWRKTISEFFAKQLNQFDPGHVS